MRRRRCGPASVAGKDAPAADSVPPETHPAKGFRRATAPTTLSLSVSAPAALSPLWGILGERAPGAGFKRLSANLRGRSRSL